MLNKTRSYLGSDNSAYTKEDSCLIVHIGQFIVNNKLIWI